MRGITVLILVLQLLAASALDASTQEREERRARALEGPVARRILPKAATAEMEPVVEPSPDGRQVAYVSGANGGLYVRDLAVGTVRQLAAAAEAVWHFAPAWSRDGKQLAFSVGDQGRGVMSVAVVDVATGEARGVPGSEVQGWINGEDWSNDGHTLLCNPADNRLALLDVGDGTMVTVTDSAWQGHGSLAPNGRFVTYAAGPDERTQIFVQAVSGATRQQLTWLSGRNESPLWAHDGSAIAFKNQVGIWVIPMAGGVPTGDARLAVSASGIGLLRWTESGLYYTQSGNTGIRAVPYQIAMDPAVGIPIAGKVEVLPGRHPDTLSAFGWSADTRRIALGHRLSPEIMITSRDPASTVVWDLGRFGHVRRFHWSEDGREVRYEPDVAFWPGAGSTVVALDIATGQVRELFPRIQGAGWFSLSGDGSRMSYYRRAAPGVPAHAEWPSAGTLIDAVVVAPIGEADGTVVATAGGPNEAPFSNGLRPALTNQGDRVLYVRQAMIENSQLPSPEASSLWVVGSDGSGARQLATAAFIQSAVWDPTGRFIAYTAKPDRADDSTVARVVNVETGIKTEIPLPGHLGSNTTMWAFVRAVDWSPDGTSLGIIAGTDMDPPWEYWVVQGLL